MSLQPIEMIIERPQAQIAQRIIRKLIGDEMQAEMNIQMHRMKQAARAMYKRLQLAQTAADRRLDVLMRVSQKMDFGDLEFDQDGKFQVRRNLKGVKKDDLARELESAWALIEKLYAKQTEVSQMIEDEILITGSEKQ